MIAQVRVAKGEPALQADEIRKFTEDALAQGPADGCEGTIMLMDPASGEALIVNLFRDQAALDAVQASSQQKIAETKEMGTTQLSGRVYPEVIVSGPR
jgi:hypothetical protein